MDIKQYDARPIDETSGKLFKDTKGWKLYIDGKYGAWPKPIEIKQKRKIWPKRIFAKLFVWSVKILMYGPDCQKDIMMKEWESKKLTLLFVIAMIGAKVGLALGYGPKFWLDAERAKQNARFKFMRSQGWNWY